MASTEKSSEMVEGRGARALVSPLNIGLIWLPIVLVSVFHYGTPEEYHYVHDILRRAYYLPIIVAAVRVGLIGGVASASAVTLAYLPHAFFVEHHFDPGRSIEKLLEIVLYFVAASVAGYLSDLERKRRMEVAESLSEQQRLFGQLVRAGRLGALGEMVAGIAHEIKNPLHALSGTAEIVDPLIPENTEERRMWEIHKEEIRRLGRISERFLSFARPARIEGRPLDMRDVAQRLEELLGSEAKQRRIDLAIPQFPNPIMVRGDVDQLTQIALNIAMNAIKAIGDRPGRIAVTVGKGTVLEKEMGFLRIENDGPPIDESEFEQLFDPFYSGGEGTGLGLSISSRIAEQHGGFVEVENGGLGVIFSLYLDLLS